MMSVICDLLNVLYRQVCVDFKAFILIIYVLNERTHLR